MERIRFFSAHACGGMDFELRLDGHATGLACALATRLEHTLPLAAFKMAHPLEVRASVILHAADAAAAHGACAAACDDVGADLRTLLAQLPPDPHAKELLWPERMGVGPPLGVTLRPRRVGEEA